MPVVIAADRCRVGYILRGRPQRHKSKKANPLDDPIHTDCVLPNGHLAGYSYPEIGLDHLSQIGVWKEKGLPGKIVFTDRYEEYYKDLRTACDYQILSTVILFKVSSRQADAFQDFWNKYKRNQAVLLAAPEYNRYTHNCSTLCYEAFKEAKILEPISGVFRSIITPKKLFNALHDKYSKKGDCDYMFETGFFGIVPDGAGFDSNNILLERKQF